MEWLISGLMETITDLASGIMGFFVKDFWKDLCIAEVTVSNGKGMFSANMMFDNYLPGASGTDIRTIFKVIGMTIVLLLLFLNLAKAFLPQEASQSIQHPFETILRGCGAAFAVFNAYLIMVVVQEPMAYIFKAIYAIVEDADDMQATFGTEVKNQVTGLQNQAPGINIDIDESFGALVGTAIVLFITLAITWGFIQLIAEVIERYVIMCFLFYVAPLPFAAMASNTTQNITSSYFRMIFSQYLLMMFNLCFVYVFCYAYSYQNGGKDFESPQDAIIFYLVLLAWLKLGRSLDEHMRSLGLSVAQTGRGLMAEAVVATTAALGGARLIKNMFGSGGPGGSAGKSTAASGSSDSDAAAANINAGKDTLNKLSPQLAQAIRSDGLSGGVGSEAVKAASLMTGIPESSIRSASIPKDFESQGMTITGNDGASVQIMPLADTYDKSMSAAGMSNDVLSSTFTNNGDAFGMYALDSNAGPDGIMATEQGIGHHEMAGGLGSTAEEIGLGSFKVTVDSRMNQQLHVPEGNYIAYDTNSYIAPQGVHIHSAKVGGHEMSFINTDHWNGTPQLKGYASYAESGVGKVGAFAGVGN